MATPSRCLQHIQRVSACFTSGFQKMCQMSYFPISAAGSGPKRGRRVAHPSIRNIRDCQTLFADRLPPGSDSPPSSCQNSKLPSLLTAISSSFIRRMNSLGVGRAHLMPKMGDFSKSGREGRARELARQCITVEPWPSVSRRESQSLALLERQ